MSNSPAKLFSHSARLLILGLLALFLSDSLRINVRGIHAQTTCPELEVWTVHWATGTTVYFSFHSTWTARASEKQQVEGAIAAWNTANTTNGSSITLAPADASHPSTLNLTVDQISTAGRVGEIQAQTSNGIITSATIRFDMAETFPDGTPIYDPTKPGGDTFVKETALQEVGHGMGLGDAKCDATKPNCGWSGQSVMNGYCGQNDSGNCAPATVTSCDNEGVNDLHNPPPPPPSGCTTDADCPCDGHCDTVSGGCEIAYIGETVCSPIIVAVGADASYQLTSPQTGVLFDIDGNGIREWLAWTRRGDETAFLVYDRNRNGIIDDGTELFGNHSILPTGQKAINGFEALAFYDRIENGGNSDGQIDSRDAIWNSMELWIDWNHNGISETAELFALDDYQLMSVSLAFHTIWRRDAYGNVFRLAAPCQLRGRTRQGYDVFFSSRPQRRPN